MASFVVYTYQFAPIFSESASLFSELNIDDDIIWYNKQKIFGSIFEKVVFKKGNREYSHDMLYNENEIIVFRLANNKHIVQEDSFITKKLDHHPSCFVIIDNRKDVQNVFIEQKSYSFEDTETVSKILKTSFNAYLKSHKLSIDIKRRYIPQETTSTAA